jgi:hypothetical protein
MSSIKYLLTTRIHIINGDNSSIIYLPLSLPPSNTNNDSATADNASNNDNNNNDNASPLIPLILSNPPYFYSTIQPSNGPIMNITPIRTR